MAEADAPSTSGLRADLVLEGGGVKGVAFAGAIDTLARAGYTFPRVLGTSAGAITGALLASMQRAGEPLDRLTDLALTLDLARLPDPGAVGKALGPLHSIADVASLVFEGGLFEGAYLESWLTGVLGDLGVRTFGDLRRDDPGSGLPVEREYGFVCVTSDISRNRMTLLPWDYPSYGLDPDDQPVVDAVRASASIPFVFEPTILSTPEGKSTLIDGGILSNFPLSTFDQGPGKMPRWPTFGIRLSAREDQRAVSRPVTSTIGIALAIVETSLEGWDARHIDTPGAIARTIFVDTAVSPLDFELSQEQQRELVAAGAEAAKKFLRTWDFSDWVSRHRR